MSATTLDSVFSGLPGLRLLGQAMLQPLAAVSRIIEVAGSTTLYRQNTPPQALHYLLDGQVTLSQSSADGTTAVIEVVHPVSSLALASVVGDHSHLMTAATVKASRLLAIPVQPLREMIATHPEVAVSMLQGLSVEVHATTRQVLDLKLRNAAQRLGCYLLSLVDDPAERRRADLRLPYQKRLLAARLGCRYENLSRAFAALREFGVETHGSRVILHDIPKLHAFSVPDEPIFIQPIPTAAEAFSQAFEL